MKAIKGSTQVRGTISLGAILLVALTVVGFGVLRSQSSAGALTQAPTGRATTGASPAAQQAEARRTMEEVTAIALARLEAMSERAGQVAPDSPRPAARVSSVVFTSRGEAWKIEPNIGGPNLDSPDASRKVWIVRADGTFLGERVPPGARPIVGSTGYIVIDDETGEVIGMGMP